jgi:hypothetical protein
MLIREGERLQAGAHARVRELAAMTAAEPETGLVFRHNAVSGFLRASTAQHKRGRHD